MEVKGWGGYYSRFILTMRGCYYEKTYAMREREREGERGREREREREREGETGREREVARERGRDKYPYCLNPACRPENMWCFCIGLSGKR